MKRRGGVLLPLYLLWAITIWLAGSLAFPFNNPTPGEVPSTGAIVYKDASNIYRFWDVKNQAVGSTSSSTDAGAVFNAAFAALPGGIGLVGYYQNLTVLTQIAIPSGCGIVGAGSSHSVTTVPPALVAGPTFPANNVVAVSATGNVNMYFVTVDATNSGAPTALRAAFFNPDAGANAVSCSFLGGTTNAAKIQGKQTTFVDVNMRFSSGDCFEIGSAPDAIVEGCRSASNTSGQVACLVGAGADGAQIGNSHFTNGTGGGINTTTSGAGIVFHGSYFDTAGGTAQIRIAGGPAFFIGCHIFASGDSSFPGGFPIFVISAGPAIIDGCLSRASAGVTHTWSSVADITAGVPVVMTGCQWAQLATPTLAGAFPTAMPLKFSGTLNTAFFEIGGPEGKASITAQVSASNTIADTSVTSYSIPANSLQVGSVYRVTFHGTLTNTSGGNVIYTAKLKYAGTTVTSVQSQVATGTSNQGFTVIVTFTVRTIGAGGTAIGSGVLVRSGGSTAHATTVATTAVDTTANSTLLFTMTMDTANANASWNCDNAYIELVKT